MSCPHYFLKTFAHLAAGLGIAGVSASYPVLYKAISDNLQGQSELVPLIIWILLTFLSLFCVFGSPPNTPIKYIAAIVFVVILGQTSGYIVASLKNDNLLARVFILTTGVFVGMLAVGWYDKQNILKFGNYLMGALLGLIISEITLMVLGSANLFSKKTGLQIQNALSFVGVAIFALIAAQNMQALKVRAASCRGNPDYVSESLNFLLTYINLFQNIARIVDTN